jgi:hypothetical protein
MALVPGGQDMAWNHAFAGKIHYVFTRAAQKFCCEVGVYEWFVHKKRVLPYSPELFPQAV